MDSSALLDFVLLQALPAQFIKWADSTFSTGRPNTLRELAHNPSWACSQPLGSKLPRGVGLSGKIECVWNTVLAAR